MYKFTLHAYITTNCECANKPLYIKLNILKYLSYFHNLQCDDKLIMTENI